MGSKVTWAKYGKWSGPRVRGTVPYARPGDLTGFDVIVAATTAPEGQSYNAVTMYDGTAVTYGLLQWTFTSGRLHRLLKATANRMGSEPYGKLFGFELKRLTGLEVDLALGDLTLNGKRVTDYFKLRDVCTPPGGRCPKTGPNWEKAKAIALLFSKLGEDPAAQRIQLEFFKGELMREITLKRPQMGGHTIASFLYPNGWAGDEVEIAPVGSVELVGGRYMMAARALFFGMWQNSPAKAQTYLGQMLGFDLSTRNGLEKLAKKFGFSTYARWGVAKAKNAMDKDGKPKPYRSRYQKVASEINKVMCQVLVPELWRNG